MRISIIQNVSFEGPGMIAEWANTFNHSISIYHAYKSELPELGTFDLLVVLSGPYSAKDEHDWLIAETQFIQEAIDSRAFVLGVCLGAQIIAKILGSEITFNKHPEIGWFPISCHVNFLKQDLKVFHWHKETFNLPQSAQLIASSKACENQAFLYGDRVLGFQFHLELAEEDIVTLLKSNKTPLPRRKFVQRKKWMKNQTEYVKACKRELFDLLDGIEYRLQEL